MSVVRVRRRTVAQIKHYLQPKEIYRTICQREFPYVEPQKATRDRAMMAACFCTGGRISAVVGGDVMKWDKAKKRSVKTGEKHEGLTWENISFEDLKKGYIKITGMKVVKRSPRVLKKYGAGAAIRDDFVIPLKSGLFENPYYDQLIPFGWLFFEYLRLLAVEGKTEGRIFDIERNQAWRIIRYCTAMFPNWFRSMCEHYRGNFIEKDSVKLAKFIKVVNVQSVSHYIGYSWEHDLKGNTAMDFAWIEREKGRIIARIKSQRSEACLEPQTSRQVLS